MDLTEQNRKIAANIEQYGWHCLHIGSSKEDEQPFSYSVGFVESFGAPEVLVFGLSQEKAHSLLSMCAELLQEGHELRPNEENSSILAGEYKVMFRPVKQQFFGKYLGTAIRYYGHSDFEAMVMFLPDKKHHFPWQAEYSGANATEPLGLV